MWDGTSVYKLSPRLVASYHNPVVMNAYLQPWSRGNKKTNCVILLIVVVFVLRKHINMYTKFQIKIVCACNITRMTHIISFIFGVYNVSFCWQRLTSSLKILVMQETNCFCDTWKGKEIILWFTWKSGVSRCDLQSLRHTSFEQDGGQSLSLADGDQGASE